MKNLIKTAALAIGLALLLVLAAGKNADVSAAEAESVPVWLSNTRAVGQAGAAVVAEGDFEKDPYGDGGSGHWKLTSDGVLTISGTEPYYEECPWYDYEDKIVSAVIEDGITYVPENAFWYCGALKHVTIPDSVTEIRSCAFLGCSGLDNVVIPKNVTDIGYAAFAKCFGLSEIVLPNGVKTIGEGAFSACTKLLTVTVPSGISSIGNAAFSECTSLKSAVMPKLSYNLFRGCTSLTDVTVMDGAELVAGFRECTALKTLRLPDSVTAIGDYAFYGCSSLSDFHIPENVTTIRSSAFYGCSSLSDLHIPEGVTTIDSRAFSGCSSLANINIPAGVEYFGTSLGSGVSSSPFYDCTNLSQIEVAPGHPALCFEDGILYSKDKTKLYFCTNASVGRSFSIPDHVTSIQVGAFSGCSNMANIKIPSGVEGLENTSYGCTLDCAGLSNIEVDVDHPSYCSVDGVLYNKGKTTLLCYPQKKAGSSFIVPGSVKTIAERSFSKCSELKHITFPASVESIEPQAFVSTGLTGISIHNTSCQISDAAYGYDTKEAYRKSIIYGYPGSTAEVYAKRWGKTFKIIGTEGEESGQGNNGGSSIKISKITLSGISNKIAAGKKIMLTADIYPAGAAKKQIIWKSSDETIASVNGQGVVSVNKKAGGKSVTITASAADGGGAKASYKIAAMKGVVKKVAVSGKKTVKAGNLLKLKAKVSATNGANKKLKWKSSNQKFATVTNSGKVKTKKAGKGKRVKITAMATDGSGKKKSVTVRIK